MNAVLQIPGPHLTWVRHAFEHRMLAVARMFALLGRAEVVWVGRGGVIGALRRLRFPAAKSWITAAGYRQKASSGTHEVITDED